MAAPQEFNVADTYVVDVRPLHPGDIHGTLILHSDAESSGTICYCRTDVASYAHVLAACGDTVAVTLDRHGNVISVQTADGLHRVEFPKHPQNEEG
jgi:hypothetical protein